MQKYRSKPVEYNGRRYASKLEAKRAYQLDMLVKAGEIKGWAPQVRVPLHSPCGLVGHYVVDFLVTCNDGSCRYEEVKGYPTDLWKWKFRHFKQEYPDAEICVLKKGDINSL